MVKIKDFTLASKNLGGGTCAPRAYTPPAHDYTRKFIQLFELNGFKQQNKDRS